MESLKILKSREIKEIKQKLKEQFGFSKDLDYVFLQNEKGKAFITNKDLSSIDFEKLKINTIGMYFAHLKDKELTYQIIDKCTYYENSLSKGKRTIIHLEAFIFSVLELLNKKYSK